MWFVHSVLLPGSLAIGLVFLVYGIINYYIIGPGDEGRREVGRENLAFSNSVIFAVLIGYLALEGILWGVEVYQDTAVQGEIRQGVDTLPVPNTPLEVQDN